MRLFTIIFATIILAGCTANIRSQLDKTGKVKAPPSVVEPVRQWVREHAGFTAPPGAEYCYVICEVELATSEAQCGMRCE